MSESPHDARLGYEVRAELADGTSTTLQTRRLVIVLGQGAELELDLDCCQLHAEAHYLSVSSQSGRFIIEPHAANSVGISVLTGRPAARAVRVGDAAVDQLLGERPFTDSAIHLIDRILPFNPKLEGASAVDSGWIPELLLLALLRGPRKVGLSTVTGMSIDPGALATEIEAGLRRRMVGATPLAEQAEFSPRLAAALSPLLESAEAEAKGLGHSYVGTEHLLLAALRLAGPDLGALLDSGGLTHEAASAKVIELLGP
jgi:hypothetical protein